MTTHIVLSGLLIALASLSGAVLVSKKFETWFLHKSSLFTAFAVGILLATTYGLAREGFEFLNTQELIISFVGGFILMWLLHYLIPEGHHHHASSCGNCLPQKSGLKILVGDAIHNIADGIVLVVAFSSSTTLGIGVAFGILIHEIIQEISEFTLLKQVGFSTKKALSWNLISAFSIFVGIGIGLFLTQDTGFQAVLLMISAGAFFHIITHDLITYSSVQSLLNRTGWYHLLATLVGFSILISIGLVMPHSHEHDHEDIKHGEIHEENHYENHEHD